MWWLLLLLLILYSNPYYEVIIYECCGFRDNDGVLDFYFFYYLVWGVFIGEDSPLP